MRFYCQAKESNALKKKLSSVKKSGGEKDRLHRGGEVHAWLPFHLVTQWFSSAPRVALTRVAIPFLPGGAWIHLLWAASLVLPLCSSSCPCHGSGCSDSKGDIPTMTLLTPSYSLSWWIVHIFPSNKLQNVNYSHMRVWTFFWKAEVLICTCLGAGLQQGLSLFPTSPEDYVVVVFL